MLSDIPRTYQGKAYRHFWPYRDINGQVIGQVIRYDGDDEAKDMVPYFKPNGKGFKAGLLPGPRPLYGMESLPDAIRERSPIIFVEGEKCKDALSNLGVAAMTSQGGSGNAHNCDFSHMKGCAEVIILPDNDESGEKYLRDVSQILAEISPTTRVRHARLPGLPDKGDVVDWIRQRVPDWDGFKDYPPGTDREAIRKELMGVIEEVAEEGPPDNDDAEHDVWPELVALPEPPKIQLPDNLPLTYLPRPIVDAATETTRFTKTVPMSAITIATSSIAAAIGNRAAVIERDGYVVPPSLCFVLVAESGERKSVVFSLLTRALLDWSSEQEASWHRDASMCEAENQYLDSRISQLQGEMKKATGESAQRLVLQVAELREKQKKLHMPERPMAFTSNATEEFVAYQMHKQGGSFAVLSGEGRIVLDIIAGKYSGKGMTGDNIYLAGIGCDPILLGRKGGELGPVRYQINKPCLNVCVMVQPDKYNATVSIPALRESGLVGRLWAARLPSMAGKQKESIDEPGLNTALMGEYQEVIRRILNIDMQRDDNNERISRRFGLSREAAMLRVSEFNKLQDRIADDGDLDEHKNITQKAMTQMVRLALVYHIARDPSVLIAQSDTTIGEETLYAAVEMGKIYLGTSVNAQTAAEESLLSRQARVAAKWLRRQGIVEFAVRDLQRQMPTPRPKSAEQAREIIGTLEDYGYVAKQAIGRGRHKKIVYRTNPAIFETNS